jgi:hypothetical protein
VPGKTATVFVMFAIFAGYPNARRAGKAINVPPPAMALTAPAAKPAAKSTTISIGSNCAKNSECWPYVETIEDTAEIVAGL